MSERKELAKKLCAALGYPGAYFMWPSAEDLLWRLPDEELPRLSKRLDALCPMEAQDGGGYSPVLEPRDGWSGTATKRRAKDE